MKTRKIFPKVLITGSFLFNTAVYSRLPARIPMHWNESGKIDSWADKGFFTVFFGPLVMLGLYLFLLVLPKIDPFKKNYAKFSGTYDIVVSAVLAFFFGLNIFIMFASLGSDFGISMVVDIGLGVLLIILGNFMGRVKRNFFLGIRTPWTIANEDVWNRTHRFGGRVMVAVGLLIILSGVIFRSEIAFWVTMAAILGMGAILTIYSYALFQKIGRMQL